MICHDMSTCDNFAKKNTNGQFEAKGAVHPPPLCQSRRSARSFSAPLPDWSSCSGMTWVQNPKEYSSELEPCHKRPLACWSESGKVTKWCWRPWNASPALSSAVAWWSWDLCEIAWWVERLEARSHVSPAGPRIHPWWQLLLDVISRLAAIQLLASTMRWPEVAKLSPGDLPRGPFDWCLYLTEVYRSAVQDYYSDKTVTNGLDITIISIWPYVTYRKNWKYTKISSE